MSERDDDTVGGARAPVDGVPLVRLVRVDGGVPPVRLVRVLLRRLLARLRLSGAPGVGAGDGRRGGGAAGG